MATSFQGCCILGYPCTVCSTCGHWPSSSTHYCNRIASSMCPHVSKFQNVWYILNQCPKANYIVYSTYHCRQLAVLGILDWQLRHHFQRSILTRLGMCHPRLLYLCIWFNVTGHPSYCMSMAGCFGTFEWRLHQLIWALTVPKFQNV